MASEPESAVSWLAQTLRTSFFLAKPISSSASIWQGLTGTPPESDENRPRQGLRQQSGEWDGTNLIVNESAHRVDVVLSPVLTASVEGMSLGPFPDHALKFQELICKWLGATDIDCVRIAVGAILWTKAESRNKAYELLGKLVPSVRYDPDTSREVLYRVNRPLKSKKNAIPINRVTTWSSILIKREVATGDGLPFQSDSQDYVSLECDHNTEARTEIMPVQERVPILQELFELVAENAVKGERP